MDDLTFVPRTELSREFTSRTAEQRRQLDGVEIDQAARHDAPRGVGQVDRDTARRRWQEPVRAQVGELGEIRPLEGGDS